MSRLGNWLVNSVATLGPWGLFLVALGDSAFIPLPQGVDFLLITQAIAAPSTAYLGAAAAVIGSVIGSFILYSMARGGGELMLRKKASSRGADKIRRHIDKYGALVLILPTMIPLPLPTKLFVIGAGVFQMKRIPFLVAVAFGRIVRYFGESFVALRYGGQTMGLFRENIVGGLIAAAIVIALFFGVQRWSTGRLKQAG
jgi:membrane protein YqaA with SNARE-associated domain